MNQIKAQPQIPNIFHFVFGLREQFTPFHLVFYLCLESCLQVNNPEALYFYYHYEPFGGYWDLIKEKLTLVKVDLIDFVINFNYQSNYIKKLNYAHQADFIRLEKLLDRGGIYADMDTLFVNKIPDYLYQKSFVLGDEGEIFDEILQENVPSLCNAFIMAEPGATFGEKWLEEQNIVFDGSWSKHSTLLPYNLSRKYPQNIHIEPARSFYKHLWTKEGIHSLLQGMDNDYQGVISMHLWSHLWWKRWRRDFSDFHAGLLTEEYVRNVDTTYNIIARKYLPQSPLPRLWAGVKFWRYPKYIIANSIDIIKDNISLASRSIYFRFPILKQFSQTAGNKFNFSYKNLKIIIRIILFGFLSKFFSSKYKKAFIYAHRQWLYRSFRKRFTSRSRFEQWHIIHKITVHDEYNMGVEKLQPTDVVIDIGAHFGTFSYLCYMLGSRNIYSYEPVAENIKLFTDFIGDLDGITLIPQAVFRSDLEPDYKLNYLGLFSENTGMASVIMDGNYNDFVTQKFIVQDPELRQIANVVPLDEILKNFERVKVLKLDCEGSEFPILLTSKFLSKVDRIVGEYHEVPQAVYQHISPFARTTKYKSYNYEMLEKKLTQDGFNVSKKYSGSNIGIFEAKNKMLK